MFPARLGFQVLTYIVLFELVALLVGVETRAALYAESPSRAELRQRLDEIYGRESIQNELPSSSSPSSIPEQQAEETQSDSSRGRNRERSRSSSSSASGSSATTLVLWTLGTLGAIGLAVLAGLALAARLDRRRSPIGATPTPSPNSGVTVTEEPREAADTIAAAGDFDLAIRELLARTVQELTRQLHYIPPLWITSREIARVAPVGNRAREVLQELVGQVERSFFGLKRAAQSDYDRCVTLFQTFREHAGEAQR